MPYVDDTEEEKDEPLDDSEEEGSEATPVSLGSATTETHGTTLPASPASIQHYKDLLAMEPMHADYHPSRLRKILGIAAGTLMGLGTGNAGIGLDVNRRIEDGPYEGQMRNYQQKLAQAKTQASSDTAAQKEQYAEGAQLATQYDKYRHGEAEGARRNAENARGGYYQGRTAALPANYAEDLAGKEALAKIQHPVQEHAKGFDFSRVSDNEGIVTNKDDGSIQHVHFDSPDGMDKLDTEIKAGKQAREILADTTGKYGPALKAAAKEKLAHEQATINSLNTRGTTLMIAPGQNGQPDKGIRVGAGTPVPQGAQTPTGINTENTETATTRTMRESAPKVAFLSSKVRQQVTNQVKQLGPLAGRWNDLWTGKVGAPNPGFKKLKVDVDLLASQLMRMHTGARGGEYIMKRFDSMLDAGKDSPENLITALDAIDEYANDLSQKQPSGAGQSTIASPQTQGKKGDPLGVR